MPPLRRMRSLLDATLVTANLGHMIRVPGLRVEDWSR